MESVVQPWVSQCTFKQQTVLLTAIRGCDGVSCEDISKKFIKYYRSLVLKNAAPKDPNNEFMDVEIDKDTTTKFVKDIEKYPMHWVMHFLQAIQLLSYYHPNENVRSSWGRLYIGIVRKMALYPETKEQCDERLKDVR